MHWLAPEIEVTIGDRTRLASVQRMEVVAARSQPVASAYLELSNVWFEWEEGAEDGDPMVLRWGYRGQDLHLVELSHLQHPAGGTVDVLVIDAHREPPIWNYDLAEDPVRDRHLARARWLRRQKKRLVATARDPDGVKYLAYKATPGGR